MKNYKRIQETEASTWLIRDEDERNEKAQRELIRYKWILKCMNLWGKGSLDTKNMIVADVGCGPLGGVSTLLDCRLALRFDPLMEQYRKYFHIENGSDEQAENIDYSEFDLIIATNCIDHFESPVLFLHQLNETADYGCYFAHFHAINNAITHPHEAHVHNINQEKISEVLGEKWELVWEMDYNTDGLTYAWRKQPAFAQLFRKITK